MDVLDIFLNKYSYKFPKGYPDMNNEQDVLLMEGILENLGVDLNEMKLQKGQLLKRTNIDTFLENFFSNTPFKTDSGDVILDTIFDYTKEDKNKQDEIKNKIQNNTGKIKVSGKYIDTGDPFEGITGNLIKTSEFGGDISGGSGVLNEKNLTNIINEYIKENGPIDIKIVDKNNKFILANSVNKAQHVGKEVTKKNEARNKADVLLITKTEVIPLSIKMDGKFRYESVVLRYKNLVNNFIEKGQNNLIPNLKLVLKDDILIMTNPETNESYGRVYITDYPNLKTDAESMIFGNDKAKVVQSTFTAENFSFDNNLLTINVTKIYRDIKDLKDEDMPIISIGRHSNRKSTKGLDFRTIPKNEKSTGGSSTEIESSYII
jgi:hypothetical protein